MYHPELEEMIAESVAAFADNLCHSDKEVRISTLKILCHYKSLGEEISSVDQSAAKKRKIEVSPTSIVDNVGNNVCFFILYTPLPFYFYLSFSMTVYFGEITASAGSSVY